MPSLALAWLGGESDSNCQKTRSDEKTVNTLKVLEGKAEQMNLSDEETNASDAGDSDSSILSSESNDNPSFFSKADESMDDLPFDESSTCWPVWPAWCPPCRVASSPTKRQESVFRDTAGPRTLTCRDVAKAVRALYKEQSKPTASLLSWYITTESRTWGHGIVAFDDAELRARCEACPGLYVEEDGSTWAVLMHDEEQSFIDIHSRTDVYPEELWAQFWAFVKTNAEAGRLPRRRDFPAAVLGMRHRLPFLQGRTLGEIRHIVQLALTRGRTSQADAEPGEPESWDGAGWRTQAQTAGAWNAHDMGAPWMGAASQWDGWNHAWTQAGMTQAAQQAWRY